MTTPKPLGLRFVAGSPLNPGNVPDPRTVDVRRIWDIEEPTTTKQRDAITARLDSIGITERDLGAYLGDGFSDVASLSKWSASWCITELDAYLNATDELALKRNMARVLRETYPHLNTTLKGDFDD